VVVLQARLAALGDPVVVFTRPEDARPSPQYTGRVAAALVAQVLLARAPAPARSAAREIEPRWGNTYHCPACRARTGVLRLFVVLPR
jgi:hypothetical protein